MFAMQTAQGWRKERFATLEAICLAAPKTPPHSVLVIFHGYGASAEDLLDLAPNLKEAMPETTQVFLQAPADAAVVGSQPVGRAWFSLNLLSYDEIAAGLKAVEDCVAQALDAISAHYAVPVERVALFGFSQGGMVALQATCNAQHAWLAAIGVATRFLDPSDVPACKAKQTTPLMMIHGEEDEVIPFQQGLATARMLQDKGYNLVWQARAGMGHAIDAITLRYVCDFLHQYAQESVQKPAQEFSQASVQDRALERMPERMPEQDL